MNIMVMKKIIGQITIAAFIIFVSAIGGLGQNQPASSMATLSIEKALTTDANSNTVALSGKSTQDDGIFSWYTIISLGLGVIGIAIFRRNTFA